MEIEGYRSVEARKRMKLVAWLVAIPLYLVQLVFGLVLVLGAVTDLIFNAITAPRPEVESAVLFEDRVHVLTQEGGREREARGCPSGSSAWSLVRLDPARGEPERLATACDDSLALHPRLAVQNGALLWLAGSKVRRIENGAIASEVEAPLPDGAKVVGGNGEPAAVATSEREITVYGLEGSAWVHRGRVSMELGDATWDAVVVPDRSTVHVFTRDGDAILHRSAPISTGWSGGLGLVDRQTTLERIELRADAFGAGVADGRPYVFALPPIAGSSRDGAVAAYTLEQGRWREIARGESDAHEVGLVAGQPLGITRDAGGGLAIEVLRLEGDSIAAEAYGSDDPTWRFAGLLAASEIGPRLLTVLAALLLGLFMSRYRVTGYLHAAEHASLFRRTLAKIVDSMIATAPALIVIAANRDDSAFLSSGTPTLIALGSGFGFFLLYAVLEGTVGWTPGKLLAGIRVVGLDLQPCGVWAGIVRGLGWAVDSFFGGFVGLLAVVLGRHQQRIGDRMAGTIVIRARKLQTAQASNGYAEPLAQPGA